jgi:hypothetical protein
VTIASPAAPANGLKIIQLMDSSLPVLSDSHLQHYDRIGFSRNPWSFSFKGSKGFIEFKNDSMYDSIFDKLPYLRAQGFDLEKFFHTNAWNPVILVLRSIARPQGNKYVVQEVDSRFVRGFVTIIDDRVRKGRRKIAATYTLYEKGDNRCLDGMVIMWGEPGPQTENLLTSCIASIRFLPPELPEAAENHFRQGNALIKQGKNLEGQVALANAVYLAPGRKDYREALEATLTKRFRDLPHTWNELQTSSQKR